MLRALKLVALLSFLLAAALACAVLVLLEWPGLLLNARTVSYAAKRWGGAYAPQWKELAFEISSRSLLTKRVSLRVADFCFERREPPLSGCFPLVELDATVKLGLDPLISVERLDKLVVHEKRLRVDRSARGPAEEAPAPPGRYSRLPQLLPTPLRNMRVGLVDVRVPKASIKTSSGTTTVRLAAAMLAQDQAPMMVSASAVTRDTSSLVSNDLTAAFKLESDLFHEGELTYLRARGTVRDTQHGLHGEVTATAENAGRHSLRLRAQALVRFGGRELHAQLSGVQTPRRYRVKASAALVDPNGPVRRLELRRCALEAPVRQNTTQITSADLRCGLRALPQPLGLSTTTQVMPFEGALSSHVDFKKHDAFEATLTADVGPVKRYYGFYAHLAAKLAGRLSRPADIESEHELRAGLRVERFQALVAYLKGTAWAVPAPFHVLDGPVAVEAHTAGPTRGRTHKIEYTLTTALTSGRQALKTEARGVVIARDLFLPSRSFENKTDVELKKVAFELPYLRVTAMPALGVDSRINTHSEESAENAARERAAVRGSTSAPVNIAYEVRVRTPSPAVLYSNLAKDPVPVNLDVTLRPNGLTGDLELKSFHMEVFRQIAEIDHLMITPAAGSSPSALDGLIVYKKEDVTINIRLLGTTAKPQVSLSSDPPLTQDEIVGVLLFGKSPGELDVDQQTSVGNAATALSGGAFGLASLYFFASTPIDYVGYDPATQTYQIKFKLPGGATLSLGSQSSSGIQETRTVKLRKRIAKNLAIETELQSSSVEQRSAIQTFLQYFRRY